MSSSTGRKVVVVIMRISRRRLKKKKQNVRAYVGHKATRLALNEAHLSLNEARHYLKCVGVEVCCYMALLRPQIGWGGGKKKKV